MLAGHGNERRSTWPAFVGTSPAARSHGTRRPDSYSGVRALGAKRNHSARNPQRGAFLLKQSAATKRAWSSRSRGGEGHLRPRTECSKFVAKKATILVSPCVCVCNMLFMHDLKSDSQGDMASTVTSHPHITSNATVMPHAHGSMN